ncbi:MAG TPA: NAD(P)/FAD-dependent oxidoreductase [Bacilli bacterium]|nr:NAD(P)/FAD-dependent oxidoreductase [Bacilli bacterium]
MNQTRVPLLIIGAGPVGLLTALKASSENIPALIIEGRDSAGGQLTELYPEKDITDIPGIELIKAKDYIALLLKQVAAKKDSIAFRFGHKVTTVNYQKSPIEIELDDKTSILADDVVIATGLGVYRPRPMGIPDEDKYSAIHYSLKDYQFLTDKRVIVLGGGDSAIDWADMCSKVTTKVTLIHRRNEFRGNILTLKNNQIVKILTPYIPYRLIGDNGELAALEIQNVETKNIERLPVDYIMVNYGNIPLSDNFGLPKLGIGIECSNGFKIANHLYAAGDIAGYEGKIRRLAPALKEIESIIKDIKASL